MKGPLTYRVELASRRVEKQILELPGDVRSRIARVMLELEESPRPHGCQKLLDDIYRLRIGKYRIIYKVFDAEGLVLIGKVARRSETTYRDVVHLF